MTPEEARAWEAYLVRVEQTAADVAEGYAMLAHLVEPEKRGARTVSRAGASGVPVDLGVIDLAAAVDAMVDDVTPMAYGALRMGFWRPTEPDRRARTLTALRWLVTAIRAVYDRDRTTGDYIADCLWAANGQIRPRTLRTGPTTYRSTKKCGECGQATIIVDPARHRARCITCRSAA